MTGTPPNLVAPDILQKKFGEGTGVTFASWMAFSMPVMLGTYVTYKKIVPKCFSFGS